MEWRGMCQISQITGNPWLYKLNAKDKKAAVMKLRLDVDYQWPGTEVIPSACAVSGLDLQRMLWHCHAVFKNLFAEPHTLGHQHAAECHAKLLLLPIT